MIDFDDPLPPGMRRTAAVRAAARRAGQPAGRRAPDDRADGADRSPGQAGQAGQAAPDAAAPKTPAAGAADATADRTSERPPWLPSLVLAAGLQAINHVLAQQAWARDRLAAFAGRSVCLAVDPSIPLAGLAPPLSARITDQGLLLAERPEAEPARRPAVDVTLWLRPSPAMLFAGLSGGARGLSAHLRVDGDVMLAAVLGEVAQHLRWDAEEDASRLVGDIAARRLFAAGAGLRDRLSRTGSRVGHSAVQFLTVEDPQLPDRRALDHLAASLRDLERRLDQLASRAASLGGR